MRLNVNWRWFRVSVARIAFGGVVAVAGSVVAAAPAQASPPEGVIAVVGTEIFVTAAPATNNFIVLQRYASVPDAWYITEFGEAQLTSSAPQCFYLEPPSTASMYCVVPGLSRIHVSTDFGADTVLNYANVPVYLNLGSGNDNAHIGGPVDTVSTVFGGAGEDYIVSGSGDDIINGGDGLDTLSFASIALAIGGDTLSTYPVTASLATGEASRSIDTDTFAGFEILIGGGGADTLTGSAAANRIEGRAGNDVINGGGGNDLAYGGDGSDRIFGGADNDQLWGGSGDDWMYGDAGTDTLTGENGLDRCHTGETASCEINL
jgi:Ca2+-binding RTX toxin-like protein